MDANVASLPAMATAHEFAFVSWDGSGGRRVCPLATFGSREPQTCNVRLVCAEPPRADQPQLKNASEIRGAIALVVRGGCSFAHKARLLQRAGAVAMLLANNTREEPLAAFTMGESPEEIEENDSTRAEPITMPCVMMCLRDVRELFQKFPPSVKTGVLDFQILPSDESAAVADECLRTQMALHEAAEAGKGWKAIKRTTTSIMKMLEPQGSVSTDRSDAEAPSDGTKGLALVKYIGDTTADLRENQPPLLAFVQWATSASSYEICFAPLADFCSARAGVSYTGKLVACDPLLADKPLTNEGQLRGAVALLRRGSCPFPEKLERVQRAGAVAAIVCNDDEEDLDAAFVMSVDKIDAANATLPAVMISHNSFLRIQPAMNCATARVLCLAGEAADGLLASSGKSVSFKTLSRPREVPKDDDSNDDAATNDTVVNLQDACRDGDHGACQRILGDFESKQTQREIVNTPSPSTGLSALHHACAAGNDNVVEFLLQLGAAPDAVDLALQTPLHIACANSHVECARLLLRAEGSAPQVPTVLYNVDEEYGGISTRKHIGGGTAMHEAARAGCSGCVELLLAANARVDCTVDRHEQPGKYVFLGVSARDQEGNTPLHVACENAHAECALYLIAANAELDTRDRSGRPPLLLACEAVNDPAKEADAMQIIEKLLASGAEMRAFNAVESSDQSTGGGGNLLLDRVESSELRREIEVLYLRQEARRAQQDSRALRKENEAVVNRVQCLEVEVGSLRSVVDEYKSYSHQLQQLQLQMQMILQFQTSTGTSSSLISTKDSVATPLLAASLEDTSGKSEEEMALDAALARDLGKKCQRQGQCVLAEKYFQRSLELMPLPGVRRLLNTARSNQIYDKADELTNSQDTNGSVLLSGRLRASSTRSIEMKRLREMVRVVGAVPQARVMLESELNKLEALCDGPDFTVASRWVEWLMALPWGDPSSGLQNGDLYTIKRNEFNQLDAIETNRMESRRNQAACTIQRTFRERFAGHLHTRVVAATRIQVNARGKLARRRYQTTKQELAAQRQRVGQSTNQQDGTEIVAPSQVNYATTVDPAILRKLQHRYHVEDLVVGALFPTQNADDISKVVERKLRVLQLVKCTEGERSGAEKHVSFFVWTRWGTDLDNMCECSLSGPYEDDQDAQRRFDRISREEDKLDKQQSLPELDTAYESGFYFLRSIVGGGSKAVTSA